ncbi:MAG: hypothetical protein IT323_16545, partial [Anaerolineae bacterium]|nr:hypothetical protein [Anaerolineae bacterium]
MPPFDRSQLQNTKVIRLDPDDQPWRVWPAPLDEMLSAHVTPPADALAVPPCRHLQPALYPDALYWGAHLRRINEQAWLYHREFDAPAGDYRRAWLHFEGVDQYAAVWVNGELAGEHESYATPFDLDITRMIRRGVRNTLLVRVTSPWDLPTPRGAYPVDHVLRRMVKGTYEHGEGVIPPDVNPLGIWRPVHLILDQGLSLDWLRITAGTDGRADISVALCNATGATWHGSLALNIEAENHDGPGTGIILPVELPPGDRTLRHTLHVSGARLWWPWDQGEPNLYTLRAVLHDRDSLPLDVSDTTFGFRSVALERTAARFTFRVNGRPVFLRGASYFPHLYFSEVSRESLARDVELAKRANLNLLRVHVHISPPELYDMCDRAGILVWQDSDLNWMHETSEEFQERALAVQRDVMASLHNHPCYVMWCCHNEPTMVYSRRENLEKRPDPALYADARRTDPTRPIFLCSGQMDRDWRRSGDSHFYYGALWSKRFTEVRRRKRVYLGSEFGAEAPAALDTLRAHPVAWERLGHLAEQIPDLWAYQAELTRFYVEHLRRLRATSCAGYVHFWLADLAPSVGCGAVDSARREKPAYAALRQASTPLQVSLEHDGRRPLALWV